MTTMKEQAKQLREVARQALYSTPNDQECEVPIMVATLREVVNRLENTYKIKTGIHRTGMIFCADVLKLCEELEAQ